MFVLSMPLSNYESPMHFGNDTTCQLQGFLVQFGLQSSVGVDSVLSLTYLLMIRAQWKEEQLRKLEKWIHIVV